jgi:hypothetical protein
VSFRIPKPIRISVAPIGKRLGDQDQLNRWFGTSFVEAKTSRFRRVRFWFYTFGPPKTKSEKRILFRFSLFVFEIQK